MDTQIKWRPINSHTSPYQSRVGSSYSEPPSPFPPACDRNRFPPHLATASWDRPKRMLTSSLHVLTSPSHLLTSSTLWSLSSVTHGWLTRAAHTQRCLYLTQWRRLWTPIPDSQVLDLWFRTLTLNPEQIRGPDKKEVNTKITMDASGQIHSPTFQKWTKILRPSESYRPQKP